MNDHLSAVAAVYDRRQTLIANGVTAVAPGGSASPKTMAILAEGAVFLEHDPAETQVDVKDQGKAAFVANALRTTRSTLATDLKRFRLSPLSGIQRSADCTLPDKAAEL